jgi:hypothetical protein
LKIIPFTRFIPALGFACALGLAPAVAQTAAGTLVPVADAAAAAPDAVAGHAAKSATRLPKSDEFTTVTAAAAHCPGGTVVWSSLSKGHSFHTSSSRYFGKTKHGAYVCEGDALASGFHQSKS